MRAVWAGLLFTPVLAWGQATFPTEFPEGAIALEPAALHDKLKGKVFELQYANGSVLRLEFKDTFAYLNVGSNSDIGKWRTEGSQGCIDWKKFPASCFEVRAKGDTLFSKRASNGEIVHMREK